MKALSIKQPWAWLICAGYKDIENREWRIGRNPRHGPYSTRDVDNFTIPLPERIYVHAGKLPEITKDTIASILRILNNRQVAEFMLPLGVFSPLQAFALGAIIGEVDIVDCVTESLSPWFVGKYGFVLTNPILYKKPIPCRGKLGFFEPDITQAEVKPVGD